MIRGIFTWVMILAFALVIYFGPLALVLVVRGSECLRVRWEDETALAIKCFVFVFVLVIFVYLLMNNVAR